MANTHLETKSGFKYKLAKDFSDDFELLELIRRQQDEPLLFIDIAKRLIGDTYYDKLKKHCTVDGRVSTAKMKEEITEISNSDPDAKK